MEKINVGIIGVGFIGQCHIEGLQRLGYVNIAAINDSNEELARQCAERFGIERCCAGYDEILSDPDIQVIHNCTPNHLHKEINLKAIESGKHIFSEKPLGLTSAESAEMLKALAKKPDVVAGINFCYRMTALIQDAKNRIAAGEIGRPMLVHGSYLQDWMLFETDYNWRADTKISGESRVIGDIGTHWMDLAQVMLGARITDVCAQTLIAHPVRKKSKTPVATFSVSTNTEYEDVAISSEDYAGVLLRFDNGTVGSFSCSQVSAGRKCFIDIEVDGSAASFQWQHQTGDSMWKGYRDQNNEHIIRNPLFMTEAAKPYAMLAAGHPEGWNDAFKNTLSSYYGFIRAGKKHGDACDFATFEDGHYLMKLIEAILKSAKTESWVHVDA